MKSYMEILVIPILEGYTEEGIALFGCIKVLVKKGLTENQRAQIAVNALKRRAEKNKSCPR